MARAVAHENEGGAVLRCILEALIAGGLHCLGGQRLRDGLLVGVGRGTILSDLPEQRLGDLDGLDLILIGLGGRTELVVLRTVHEVRRLDHEMLDAVVDGTLQRLVHVVDLLAITRLDVIDDDLRGEGTTHRPVRIRCLQRLLDPADVLRTAVVEGGTEAHDEKLLLADTVLVQRIILAGIPGVAAEIIRISLLTLDERLLRICQLVPGRLRLRTLCIGILGPLLYIDRIDPPPHCPPSPPRSSLPRSWPRPSSPPASPAHRPTATPPASASVPYTSIFSSGFSPCCDLYMFHFYVSASF